MQLFTITLECIDSYIVILFSTHKFLKLYNKMEALFTQTQYFIYFLHGWRDNLQKNPHCSTQTLQKNFVHH